MKNRSIITYLVLLVLLCAGFVVGARLMGRQGMYLAGGYMLTPALAAILTRLLVHKPRFRDAGLRFGRLRDYVRFWLYSLALTAVSFLLFTAFGAIRWDLSGQTFLDLLAQQFAAVGQDMSSSLPQGFTPQMMVWLYFVGGLTIFNILPGLITGFGEEFGHRGLMYPLLFPRRRWLGLIVGGLLWYLWHQPLLLILPAGPPAPLWQTVINHVAAIIGSICTHIYLCYVYAKSRSIFVPSVAHITMNNATRSLSYFVVLQNQFTANLAQYLVPVIVVAILYASRELGVVTAFTPESGAGDS